ncbi:hypothetical protein BCR32DRAFT_265753 [Anaeromyces robustus]|uniref:Uncharacterized protein n=1 Tax=Anaeromyces robustus TaxID=1754192 RepID=A0A1Y1XHY8_9FUNG|nr:hypothetical protein BCR32DRAFT_265753 [Anaeromyces robustus]|eukprot:ORX85357.1 hypothetical protein BCR32DRAFT_265753 [Anaeromyces robustus]
MSFKKSEFRDTFHDDENLLRKAEKCLSEWCSYLKSNEYIDNDINIKKESNYWFIIEKISFIFQYINQKKDKDKRLHYKILYTLYLKIKRKYNNLHDFFSSLTLNDINDFNLQFFFRSPNSSELQLLISYRKKTFRTDKIDNYTWLITHKQYYRKGKKKPSESKSGTIDFDYNFLYDSGICDTKTYKIIKKLKSNLKNFGIYRLNVNSNMDDNIQSELSDLNNDIFSNNTQSVSRNAIKLYDEDENLYNSTNPNNNITNNVVNKKTDIDFNFLNKESEPSFHNFSLNTLLEPKDSILSNNSYITPKNSVIDLKYNSEKILSPISKLDSDNELDFNSKLNFQYTNSKTFNRPTRTIRHEQIDINKESNITDDINVDNSYLKSGSRSVDYMITNFKSRSKYLYNPKTQRRLDFAFENNELSNDNQVMIFNNNYNNKNKKDFTYNNFSINKNNHESTNLFNLFDIDLNRIYRLKDLFNNSDNLNIHLKDIYESRSLLDNIFSTLHLNDLDGYIINIKQKNNELNDDKQSNNRNTDEIINKSMDIKDKIQGIMDTIRSSSIENDTSIKSSKNNGFFSNEYKDNKDLQKKLKDNIEELYNKLFNISQRIQKLVVDNEVFKDIFFNKIKSITNSNVIVLLEELDKLGLLKKFDEANLNNDRNLDTDKKNVKLIESMILKRINCNDIFINKTSDNDLAIRILDNSNDFMKFSFMNEESSSNQNNDKIQHDKIEIGDNTNNNLKEKQRKLDTKNIDYNINNIHNNKYLSNMNNIPIGNVKENGNINSNNYVEIRNDVNNEKIQDKTENKIEKLLNSSKRKFGDLNEECTDSIKKRKNNNKFNSYHSINDADPDQKSDYSSSSNSNESDSSIIVSSDVIAQCLETFKLNDKSWYEKVSKLYRTINEKRKKSSKNRKDKKIKNINKKKSDLYENDDEINNNKNIKKGSKVNDIGNSSNYKIITSKDSSDSEYYFEEDEDVVINKTDEYDDDSDEDYKDENETENAVVINDEESSNDDDDDNKLDDDIINIYDILVMFSNIIRRNYQSDFFIHKFLINYIQYSLELSYSILTLFKYISSPKKHSIKSIPRPIQNILKFSRDFIEISDFRISEFNPLKDYDVLSEFLIKTKKYGNNDESDEENLFNIYNIFNENIINKWLIYFDSPFLKFVKPYKNNFIIRDFDYHNSYNINLYSRKYPGSENDIPNSSVSHYIHDFPEKIFNCLLYDKDDDSQFWIELNKWYNDHPYIFKGKMIEISGENFIKNINYILPLIATVFYIKIEYNHKIYQPLFTYQHKDSKYNENNRFVHLCDDPLNRNKLYYLFYEKKY